MANVITNAALLEQTVISGSKAMIFFTLVTKRFVSLPFNQCAVTVFILTRQLGLARYLFTRRDGCSIVGHSDYHETLRLVCMSL